MIAPAQFREYRSMAEDALQRHVRKMCDARGLVVEHVENSLAGRCWCPGWPDLTIVGPGGILYRELKSMGQGPSSAQRRIGAAINCAGGNWKVWQPIHYIDGTIERELDAITGRTTE